jgi:hypothetical protein
MKYCGWSAAERSPYWARKGQKKAKKGPIRVRKSQKKHQDRIKGRTKFIKVPKGFFLGLFSGSYQIDSSIFDIKAKETKKRHLKLQHK